MTTASPYSATTTPRRRRSAERLRDLRDAGHTVLPGHDPEVLRPGPVAT